MKVIRIEDAPKQIQLINTISRARVNEIINKIGIWDRNIYSMVKDSIELLENSSKPMYAILDEMNSCDPGIKILNTDKTFEDYLLWWEDNNVEFIVIIDGSTVWNSTNVCYIRNKHTGERDRSLIISGEDAYEKTLKTDKTDCHDILLEKILEKPIEPIKNLYQYMEIRPIINDNEFGEDFEDYPDPEKWIGFYYDWSYLNWFIKNVFKNGLANIAIIKS